MEANLAVLIDFENIAAGTEKEGLGRFNVDALMQRVKDKGRILIARSYADWGRFSRFKQSLLTANVTMLELTSHGMQDKNRADIALVVDALELAFTKDYVDTFVIVSGDSDFTPMVQKMRELNKRVIGIGTRRSTSRLLIQACDEFVFYDSIVRPARNKPQRPRKSEGPLNKQGAFDLLSDALEGLMRENPTSPLGGVVKQAMLRKSPDFNEGDLGFGSFTRFLEAAAKADVVALNKDPKAGGYRVESKDGGNGADAIEGLLAPSSKGDEYVDSYLPEGTEMWVNALAEAGIHPLSYPTRADVLEAFSSAVATRKKRRRKTTAHFVAEDVKKELRRTHPEIPLNMIRGIVDALMKSGVLLHRDGKPVRTASASFRVEKSAEEMNLALMNTYLAHLREAGCEMTDAPRLAKLLLGDAERAREVEEALAWLLTSPAQSDEADLNDVDLDSLLSADPEPVKDEAEDADAAPESKDADEEAKEEPAAEEEAVQAKEEAPPAEEKKPKRRRTRKTKAEILAAAEAKAAAADSASDLDALLESPDAEKDA